MKSTFRLSRPSGPLPSEKDFDPVGGDLDAQVAWKHLGDLTLDQAHKLFIENPGLHQEDFMFMGSQAFDYYFPVVDRYLREVTPQFDGDDCDADILGSGVAAQLDWENATLSGPIHEEISVLAGYVRAHLQQYSNNPKTQRQIDREWAKVEANVERNKNTREQVEAPNRG